MFWGHHRQGQKYDRYGRAGFAGDIGAPTSISSGANSQSGARCACGALSGVRNAFESVCQYRHPPSLRRQTHGMVHGAAWLAGADLGFPRRRGSAVHRCRAQGVVACGFVGRRHRYRRHGVFDGHRDADAGGARRRQARLSGRRVARSGIRLGMRGRRVRLVDCIEAGSGAARHQCAAGRARTLHACRPT